VEAAPAVTTIPAGQIRGAIALGPTTYVACGPCSLSALRAWEKAGGAGKVVKLEGGAVGYEATGVPRPNVVAYPKAHMRKHLRQFHGVTLDGKDLKFRERRQGCQHSFTTSARCDNCGVTQRDIAGRVKR
jgi:hypothetical protein